MGQASMRVITEKKADALAQKVHQIYGRPVTADEAVTMANDGFQIEEAERDRERGEAP
jgi:hypothetical protein